MSNSYKREGAPSTVDILQNTQMRPLPVQPSQNPNSTHQRSDVSGPSSERRTHYRIISPQPLRKQPVERQTLPSQKSTLASEATTASTTTTEAADRQRRSSGPSTSTFETTRTTASSTGSSARFPSLGCRTHKNRTYDLESINDPDLKLSIGQMTSLPHTLAESYGKWATGVNILHNATNVEGLPSFIEWLHTKSRPVNLHGKSQFLPQYAFFDIPSKITDAARHFNIHKSSPSLYGAIRQWSESLQKTHDYYEMEKHRFTLELRALWAARFAVVHSGYRNREDQVEIRHDYERGEIGEGAYIFGSRDLRLRSLLDRRELSKIDDAIAILKQIRYELGQNPDNWTHDGLVETPCSYEDLVHSEKEFLGEAREHFLAQEEHEMNKQVGLMRDWKPPPYHPVLVTRIGAYRTGFERSVRKDHIRAVFTHIRRCLDDAPRPLSDFDNDD